MATMNDSKYVTFKREEYQRHTDPGVQKELRELEIQDAVVIRRQDKFASPALATYAAMIAIVASEIPEIGDLTYKKEELLQIADYFEDQARLAAEEGWKVPDL